jgi:hypothetical protein
MDSGKPKDSSPTKSKVRSGQLPDQDRTRIKSVLVEASNSKNPDLQILIKVSGIIKERGAIEAIDLFLTMPPGFARKRAICIALHELSRTDLKRASEIASGLGCEDVDILARSQIYVPPDVDHCAEYILAALSIENPNLKAAALKEIVASGSDLNYVQLAALLGDDSCSNDIKQIIQAQYVKALAATDPTELVKRISDLPADLQIKCAANVIKAWSSDDLNGAVKWLQSINPTNETVQDCLMQLISRNSVTNPDGIKSMLDGLKPGLATDNAYGYFSGLLYSKNPEDCLSWYKSLPEGAEKERVLREYISRETDKSPQQALNEVLTESTNQGTISNMRKLIFNKWGSSDPKTALEWIDNSKNIDLQALAELKESCLMGWVANNYKDFVEKSRNDPALLLSDNVVWSVINSYSRDSFVDTGEWLVASNLLNSNRVSALLGNWLAQDPIGASEWARSLPAGEIRDKASISIVGNIAAADPVSARAWAESIADKEMRLNALKIVEGHK